MLLEHILSNILCDYKVMCREVWNVYVRMCVHMYVCVGAYVWEEYVQRECMCVHVVCFIVAAAYISHLLKKKRNGS